MNRDQQIESDFYTHMHQLDQIDDDWSREVLEFYVPHFERCRRVLDVGCGEGHFIELLNATGIKAIGIDLDSEMVRTCHLKDLEAVQANLFDYLPQHIAAFDGVFSSNVIEHLCATDASRFAKLAWESLSPGGVFVVATPNPASLIVHLHEFWRDPTHVRLYTAPLLEFILSRCGFDRVHSAENPRTRWTPLPAFSDIPHVLRDLSPWEEHTGGVLAMQRQPAPSEETKQRPFWRRLTSGLRRRIARILAETVLFEEFETVDDMLLDLGAVLLETRQQVELLQQVDRALYYSLDTVLTAPREVYAKGAKPTGEVKESM